MNKQRKKNNTFELNTGFESQKQKAREIIQKKKRNKKLNIATCETHLHGY